MLLTGQAFLFNVFFVFCPDDFLVESQAFRERVSRNHVDVRRFRSRGRVCHGVWVCVILWVQSGFVCLRVRLGSAGCSSVEVRGC